MEHALYEVIRDMESLAKEQGRKRSPAEESILRRIYAHTNPLFASAMR